MSTTVSFFKEMDIPSWTDLKKTATIVSC